VIIAGTPAVWDAEAEACSMGVADYERAMREKRIDAAVRLGLMGVMHYGVVFREWLKRGQVPALYVHRIRKEFSRNG